MGSDICLRNVMVLVGLQGGGEGKWRWLTWVQKWAMLGWGGVMFWEVKYVCKVGCVVCM
jgi:hypothetical protein